MKPNVVDWAALVIVLLTALGGMRRGLVVTALSLGGLLLGGWAGSRVAPHLLHGGASSQWTPLASLVGAIFGATIGQTLAALAGSFVRGGLRLAPFRLLDSIAGLGFGAATGVALVWVLGATALLAPGATGLRNAVQRSLFVRQLEETVPPHRLLHLLARIDPFPSIAGPAAPSEPPSPSVTGDPVISRASQDVVRVLGTACGVGIEGTGWFARSDLVVTAAHVVAGESDTRVQIQGANGLQPAQVVAFDSHNDVAVLRVAGVTRTPLPIAPPADGASVAIVGYPENGPLTATAGRVGRTAIVLTEDAYGHGPVPRSITALSGLIRHGNSGGPAIDTQGRVESTVFAARIGAPGGYGIPGDIVDRDLASAEGASAQGPVSTGACAAG